MGKKAIAAANSNIPGLGPPEPPKPKAKPAAVPAKAKDSTPAAPAEPKAAIAAKAAAAGEPKKAAAPKAASAPATEAKAPAAASAKAPASKAPAAKAAAAAPATKAAAKGKAAAPVPQPVEAEADEARKKKTRRGGGKKKSADGTEEGPSTSVISPQATAAALKAAEKSADEDADLMSLKKRLNAAEGPIAKGGATQALRKEIESISKDIDDVLAAKKAKAPKSTSPSAMLAQSLQELEEAEGEEFDVEMIQDVRKQLDDARAAEVFTALRGKLLGLKARCEDAVKALSKALPGDASGRGDAEREEQKEAEAMRRLAKLIGKEGEVIPASKIFKKSVALEPDAMKYLFTAPFFFAQRFERIHQVVLEANRPPKGAGKGALAKDATLTGMGVKEVERCATTLTTMDFSSESKEIDISFTRSQELEKELGVFIFKARNANSTTVFGTKDNIAKAFAQAVAPKVEVPLITEKMSIDASKVKVMQPLLYGWKFSTGATIKVDGPEVGTAKVTITAKAQEDVDAAKAKVKAFDESMACESVSCDTSKLNRAALKEIMDAHKDVSVAKLESSLALCGPASEIKTVKDKVIVLIKRSNVETVKHAVAADQIRIFDRETLQQISRKSNSDVRRSRQEGDNSLVIQGDQDGIAKARAEIQEVLTSKGATGTASISEELMKSMLMNSGAKIRDIEKRIGVSVNLDKKEGKASLLGSESAIEEAKEELAKFQAAIDKEIAEMRSIEIEIDYSQVRFVIGPKGSVVKKIREESGAQVSVHDKEEKSVVELKGKQDEVEKAQAMITDILADADKGPVKDVAPKAKPKPKADPSPTKSWTKKEKDKVEFKESADDFPTLGGGEVNGQAKAPVVSAAWGKKAEEKEAAKVPASNTKEHFPSLGGGANGKSAEVTAVERQTEEEADGDCDDPFAMMSGMGAEEVYKETLTIEPTVGASAAQDVPDEDADVEEEEAGEGMDDPFAMMGGMGEETFGEVTMTIEPTTGPSSNVQQYDGEDEGDAAEEEAAEGDMDPFDMMGGMGEETFGEVTMTIEPTTGPSSNVKQYEGEDAGEEEEEEVAVKPQDEAPAEPARTGPLSWADRMRASAAKR